MRASLIHPQLRWQFRWAPSLPVANKPLIAMTRVALKTLSHYRLPTGVTREVIEFAQGGAVEIYTPAERSSDGALLWIHGGGLVLDRTGLDNRSCIETARALGIVVVSVTYRLAPEHPFPVPLHDCVRAWDWLQENAEKRGIDPQRLAIGGQSAGGGLTASLVQLLHDRGGIQPVAQWLFCPMLDDRTAQCSDLQATRYPIWDNRSNRAAWRAYLGAAAGADETPDYAVPARREVLTGLPATWIGTGDVELFYDENVRYADALRAQGVAVEHDVVAGAIHAFEMLAYRTEVAKQYWARAWSWLATQLDGAGQPTDQ